MNPKSVAPKEHIKKELRSFSGAWILSAISFLLMKRLPEGTFRCISISISSLGLLGSISDNSASTGTVIRRRGKNLKSAGYAEK